MFKSSLLEWIVTILAFGISAAILLLAGYGERVPVGAISFGIAAAAYFTVVRSGKKRNTLR